MPTDLTTAAQKLRDSVAALPFGAQFPWHLHRDADVGDVLAGNGQHEVCLCDDRNEGAHIARTASPDIVTALADLLDAIQQHKDFAADFEAIEFTADALAALIGREAQ